MKILWFTWKDLRNPASGGAEFINEEIAKQLVTLGHEVVFLTAGFVGSLEEEVVDGYKVIRLGNRWTVYWKAYKYYKKFFKNWADIVIDEINTIPFFCKFFVQEKNIIFIHQLCREIWFFEMFFPLNIIGFLLEPIMLRALNDRVVITVSESTKTDLLKLNFKSENVHIIRETLDISPVKDINKIEKFQEPTILCLGSVRPMKRTDHIIKVFEMLKKEIPSLRLIVAGGGKGKYFHKILRLIKNSTYKEDISYLGKIDTNKKNEILQKSSLLVVTSVREGWGLVVSEANSQGTPVVCYDVPGLRDSTNNGVNGLLADNSNISDLAEKIRKVLTDKILYKSFQINGLEKSLSLNTVNSLEDFLNIIKRYVR